jgi:hypothetical protein
VEESVLSEAKARLLEDLKLLVDERSLCLVQKRALFALELSKGQREHSILLADHPGQNTKTRARDSGNVASPSYPRAEPAADLP